MDKLEDLATTDGPNLARSYPCGRLFKPIPRGMACHLNDAP